MSVAACHPIREHIRRRLDGHLPGPWTEQEPLNWTLRSTDTAALSAQVSDSDDIIEFGLLERALDDGSHVNVLQAAVALENQGQARLFVFSDAHPELQASADIDVGALERLNAALDKMLEYLPKERLS